MTWIWTLHGAHNKSKSPIEDDNIWANKVCEVSVSFGKYAGLGLSATPFLLAIQRKTQKKEGKKEFQIFIAYFDHFCESCISFVNIWGWG